jgi:saccharopine dehydrogenase-like NADP-dependent oxidoreductase
VPHPERPYEEVGVKLGDYQLERASQWKEAGLLALVGIGIEPGAADVFARHAADDLFSEIDEIGIRDGANLVVEGYDFAPTFSIWTTIEECLNPLTGLGKDGAPRKTYLYHVVDNEWSMREYGSQAVVWQTALNPVIALELLAAGEWKGTGVLGPEAFLAAPFLAKLEEYGAPHGVLELA